MTAKKRLICIVFALALTAGLFAALGGAALAASGEPVPYVDAQGKTQTVQDPTPLAGDTTAWDGGWYVVQGSVSIEGRITVTGTAHLILADGAKLDAKQGITTTGATLNIYGQSQGTGTLTASGNVGSAGIGGGVGGAGGRIIVNGGAVTAIGNGGGAGIGGGYRGIGGNITVNGGAVTAIGNGGSAGIGGGYRGSGGRITVNGGTLNATGNDGGAGVGGSIGGAGGEITVNGGTVTATGNGGSAGIGGGLAGAGGTIAINGGSVTAIGDSVGIGGGKGNGTLTLGTEMYLYSGESEAAATYVPEIDGDYQRDKYMRVNGDIPASLTVTYKLNGGTGTVPTDTERYKPHDSFTVLPNTGTRKGYVFAEWNTRADGSGRSYAPGETCVISGDVTLYARWSLPYIDRIGSTMIELICDDFVTVTGNTTTFEDEMWYVVDKYVTIGSRITVKGNAHLILADGADLRAIEGITTTGAELNIYGQSQGSGTVWARGGDSAAAIGGVRNGAGGTVIINGGTVTANGGDGAAGIGGGYVGAGGTVIINGGTVTANGGGAGIGSGVFGAGGTVTINGGNVTANGGSRSAGIGVGHGGAGGTVTITGGTVTATGLSCGAGIGGNATAVTITGGSVKAFGVKDVPWDCPSHGIGGNYHPDDGYFYDDGTLTLGEGMYLYGGGSEAEAVHVPEVDGDYRRSRYMLVNNTLPSYKVSYDLNGGTGTAPTDARAYHSGDEVNVLPTTATLAGRTLKEWNTKADGSGTAYVPGDSKTGSFVITDDITLYAQWAFYYMDWDGSALVEKLFDDAHMNRIAVTDSTTALDDGKWYVVTDAVTVNDRITVSGTAHLIVCDGAALEAKQGITVNEGNSLILHGQSGGTGTLNAGSTEYAAGIGGGERAPGGEITVNGGMVTATGGIGGAGIGGGFRSYGGSLTVNGGTVTATGGANSAGIGPGNGAVGGDFTMNGGAVTATGAGNYPGIYSTVTLGRNVTVWAGNSPNPKATGKIVTDTFASRHEQIYVYAALGAPMISGADLVLDGVLRLRFYAALPGGFDPNGASMEFTVHGRSYTRRLSEAERIDDKYAFTCPVYSIEMAEPVKAVFRYGADGTAEGSLSVAEYLDAVEAYAANLKLSGRDAAALENTLTAVRNYGHYMQAYLAGVHGFTVGEGEGFDYRVMPAASEITPLTELPAFRRVWGPNRYDPDMVDTMQYFDDFDEATTLNIDITLKSAPASVTATVDGEAWSVQDRGGGSYRISIPGIAANNLGKQWHVKLMADGKIVYDAKLSALSYVSALLDANRDQPGEREAITAFYRYYEAVKALE